MVNVKNVIESVYQTFKLKELVRNNWRKDRTSFVGTVHDSSGVFLITHSTILLMENPSFTWSEGSTDVRVDRFVDLDVVVREQI